MTLLSSEHFLVLCGLFVAALSVHVASDGAHPRRWGSAAFWALLALALGAGKWLPPHLVGYALIIMATLVATGQVAVPTFGDERGEERKVSAARLKNRLLTPLLLVPTLAVLGGFSLALVRGQGFALVRDAEASQVALGLGCVLGLLLALRLTHSRVRTSVEEGGRLLQLIGWTVLLPPMLATLGGVFAKAGVGDLMAQLVASTLPVHLPFAAVLVYCAGMALFTLLLGNAFAAFPLVTLGVGVPFIVQQHHGDPAIVGALGMLSGYCGTLLTPMAANFNVVPARLLELRDEHAVIKAQAPFAAALWLFNLVVMYLSVYASVP